MRLHEFAFPDIDDLKKGATRLGQQAKDLYKDTVKNVLTKKPANPAGDKPATLQTNKSANDKPASDDDEIIPTKGRVTGPYGRTVTAPNGNKIPHPGVDIAAPEGTPVVAPADGRVVTSVFSKTAGNLIELITDDGKKHRFMHLSARDAKAGDVVKKGDRLGAVGNTGFSKGNHLHWEKYAKGGQQLNPLA